MTIVSALDFSQVTDGVRKYIKVSGYRQTELDAKWARDEFDLVDTLSAIKIFMKDTHRMMGKKKHAKTPFNHIEDVTKDMEEMMVVGKTKEATAVLRKKNLAMFHLVIDPVMKVLEQLADHAKCIAHVDEIIDYVCHMVLNSGIETTRDDAIVAKHQVAKMVADREAARKAAQRKRPRKKAVEETEVELEAVTA